MAATKRPKRVWLYPVPGNECSDQLTKPFAFITLTTGGVPGLFPADCGADLGPIFIRWEHSNGYAGTPEWFEARWSWSRRVMMAKDVESAIRHAEQVLDHCNEVSYMGLVA